MIKLFALNKKYKPFFDNEFSKKIFVSKGIIYTKNIFKADVLICPSKFGYAFKLGKILIWFGKKILVWTNEPRIDTTFKNFKKRNLYVMNVYSKDVFYTNTHFLGSYHYFPNDLGINLDNLLKNASSYLGFEQRKFCVALFEYKNPIDSRVFYNNKDISLNKVRQDLAIYFYKKGDCDILGSSWPKEIKITEESGYNIGVNNWWDRKMQILKNYKFNICIENTAFPHYCTEKIWHAIICGCLPIYTGDNTAIYETFPKDSFIDVSRFKSFDHLYDYLTKMTEEEFAYRYSKCYNVLLSEFRTTSPIENKIKILENVVKEIHSLANS